MISPTSEAPPIFSPAPRHLALAEAVAWLTDWRAEHPGTVPAAELLGAAAAAGIASATLHRARKQLGLRTRKTADGWKLQ